MEDNDCPITIEDIVNATELFKNSTYNPATTALHSNEPLRCWKLMLEDYKVTILKYGEHYDVSNYPYEIFLPSSFYETDIPRRYFLDMERFIYLIRNSSARFNDCFPAPVICAFGKYICRASCVRDHKSYRTFTYTPRACQVLDIELLRLLEVNAIINFSARDRTRDESRRYATTQYYFQPFPDIFDKFDQRNDAETIFPDWKKFPSVELQKLGVDEDWNVVKVTQVYIQNIIGCIKKTNCAGVLIQSLSGESRSSIFTSLLRILLWSEQIIHKKFDPVKIVYFTMVYDWFMFNCILDSNSPYNRISALKFCFYMLDFLVDREYMFCSEHSEDFCKERAIKLSIVKDIFLHVYETVLIPKNQKRTVKKIGKKRT